MAENLNPYSKPSPEEQELWWKEGMKGKNFQRLYNARIAKREAWNNRNGVTTTYYNESSNLPDFVITAPKETEKQKLEKRKQEKENLIDLAITGAGFVPYLDTVTDIADISNSFRKGDYSGMLWGVAGLGLPVAGKVLKSGWNWLENISSIRNYVAARKISSAINDAVKDGIQVNKNQTPSLKQYGTHTTYEEGPLRLGYTTSGVKQIDIPTGNYHWREDITDINNPVLLDIKPDKHYTKNLNTPVIKEVINSNDILRRIGIVPISNNSLLDVEKIIINPSNKLTKVGQRFDLNLSPNRVVLFEYKPRLIDNKGRLVSSNASRYFVIPTKIEHLYTLLHKSGGKI